MAPLRLIPTKVPVDASALLADTLRFPDRVVTEVDVSVVFLFAVRVALAAVKAELTISVLSPLSPAVPVRLSVPVMVAAIFEIKIPSSSPLAVTLPPVTFMGRLVTLPVPSTPLRRANA